MLGKGIGWLIMGRREEKRNMTRQQILSAAAELFAVRGYENTTLEDVTEKANVSKGTLYYNFESKEDLVVAMRREALAGTVEQAFASMNEGKEPLSVLERLLMERASFTEKNPELATVFYTQRIQYFFFRDEQSQTELNEDGTPKRQYRKAIHDLVCEAQKRGEIRADCSPQELAAMISATFLHAQGTWLASDRSSSLIDKTHRWLHMLLDGAGAKGYRDKLECVTVQSVAVKTLTFSPSGADK
jgi:AcrR family transcriptional regulator